MEADPLLLTISSTPGGAPLIEVPGTGQFDLHPAVVQALAEGASYHFNIWLREPFAKVLGIGPVRCGGTSAQQSCLGQEKGTAADRRQHSPLTMTLSQPARQRGCNIGLDRRFERRWKDQDMAGNVIAFWRFRCPFSGEGRRCVGLEGLNP